MRRFYLDRKVDISKVSGKGKVAEGIQFSDGHCAIHWFGKWPTTTPHPGGIQSIEGVHGHEGTTEIVWIDPPEGWFPFGYHADARGGTPELEFSEEVDEDDDPRWERPVRPPVPNTKEQNIAFRKDWDARIEAGMTVCPHCGSADIDRGGTSLDMCRNCGGMSRNGVPLVSE